MVVIGFLGTVLDAGPKSFKRWEKWRPTVSLCQHNDMIVERLELLVDDQYQKLARQIVSDIKQVSPETEVILHAMNFDNPWDFEEVYSGLHEFAKNYSFKPDKEEYYIHVTTGTHVAQICLFLLTEANFFPAKLLQSSPPKKKASSLGQFTTIDLDVSKYDRIAERFSQEQKASVSFLKSGIHTQNKGFNETIAELEEIALKTKEPIVLYGAQGVGKSKLARRIYELKKSRNQIMGDYIEINCAGLNESDEISLLFGHQKGAFPGAIKNATGLLAKADQGVLFLNHINALSQTTQVLLMQAIEKQCYLPLGAEKFKKCNFQLIVGSAVDLSQEVKQGNFRHDLFARLNLWKFNLPPLYARKEDIPPNIQYELEQYAKRYHRKLTFNKEAYEKYLAYCLSNRAKWTANFRDLSSSIHRMATLAQSGRIKVKDVELEIERLDKQFRELTSQVRQDDSSKALINVLNREAISKLDLFDQLQLSQVIEICHQEQTMSAAGRRLYNVTRKHKKTVNDADRLKKYLARFNLTWQDIKQG